VGADDDAAVKLWPEEYEALRGEARRAAEELRDQYAELRDAPSDPHARVAHQRATLPLPAPSPLAVDEEVAGVPCRVFRPTTAPRGTYVQLHGGAMVLGEPRMDDPMNEALCQQHRVTVISVDYRLAPEHPWPAGPDDCFAVASWAVDNDRGPLLLGGSSAGAYLAAVTILRVRDELGAAARFIGCNFEAGYYDHGGTPSARGVRPTDVPDVLDPSLLPFVVKLFLPDRSAAELRKPSISPLYADLRGLPPALFTVGSADHLLDDSLFMATRWAAHESEAELAVYPDGTHGFTRLPTQMAAKAQQRIDAFFERVLDAGEGRH
jgi:acetyl esterase